MQNSDADSIQFSWTNRHTVREHEYYAEPGTILLVVDYQRVQAISSQSSRLPTRQDSLAVATCFAKELIANRHCEILGQIPALVIKVHQQSYQFAN